MILDHHEQTVLDNIRDYGCQVQYVFDENGEEPDFAYSIGFPVSVDQLEVIVFGLKRELMISMVNEVHRQCAKDGLILEDGLSVDNLIQGFTCVIREIQCLEAIKEHFGWAIWYHRTQQERELENAYQIVWPGAQRGLFPWEEGCDGSVIEMQPPLYNQGGIH